MGQVSPLSARLVLHVGVLPPLSLRQLVDVDEQEDSIGDDVEGGVDTDADYQSAEFA